MLRDAFINGLTSSSIRQRLLEKDDLNLERAFDLALSLDRAQEQSLKYIVPVTATAAENFLDDTSANNHSCASASNKESSTNPSKKCFFCGGKVHPRSQCLAKDANCFKCGKKGHFARACKAKDSNISTSATYQQGPYLSSIIASAPNCLQSSIIEASINGQPANALLDTGSSMSFIAMKYCKKFVIPYTKKNSNVNMASTIHTARINGEARVNLEISGKTYTKFTLGVIDNLCADVILGLDFMKEHEEVRFKLHGNKSLLEVDSGVVKRMDNVCLVMAANVDPPRIF